MGYMTVVGHCINCGAYITFNPFYVPSIRVGGVREPLCRACFARWNELHRTRRGLDSVPLHPAAYEPEPEESF